MEVFDVSFLSVFNNTDKPWAAWPPEQKDHECGNCDFPFVEAETVRDQLYQLNVLRSLGPDGIHPRVLRSSCSYGRTSLDQVPKVLGGWGGPD